MKAVLSFVFFMMYFVSVGQFAPAAGKPGSTAISKDSSIISGWAQEIKVIRGYINIKDKSAGKVDYGDESAALGKADNEVVSLGDSGIAVVYFENPVTNGPSWDFAVFENGFSDDFLELAFVEVSSDGEHFFRFPAISLTDTTKQVETFGTLQPEKIHNLAGKYRAGYGVPFDLDSLPDNYFLDKNNIKYIIIKDVIGSIDPRYANRDKYGHIINDPFPTPFNTGGFDLDAVAVIHAASSIVETATSIGDIRIYPVPATDFVTVETGKKHSGEIRIYDAAGLKLKKSVNFRNAYKTNISLETMQPGVYMMQIFIDKKAIPVIKKFIILNDL